MAKKRKSVSENVRTERLAKMSLASIRPQDTDDDDIDAMIRKNIKQHGA